MWGRSRSNEYKSFRTFIMGTKNQPMFPNGVLYEGIFYISHTHTLSYLSLLHTLSPPLLPASPSPFLLPISLSLSATITLNSQTGVSETPTFFRGESGANDSIIPTCDNILCLTQVSSSLPLPNISSKSPSVPACCHRICLPNISPPPSSISASFHCISSTPVHARQPIDQHPQGLSLVPTRLA